MEKFDARASKYTAERVGMFEQANAQMPGARFLEREHVIARLRLGQNNRFCDVSAGSGFLSDGVRERAGGKVDITCVENSQAFIDILNDKYTALKCPLADIAAADAAFDRMGCLVGVHHQENKLAFYREAFRVLESSGVLVIGDVLEGSPPALFLNNSVDRYSDIGHDGMFLREDEIVGQLSDVGFVSVSASVERYAWDFPDEASMLSYCKNLFRMTKATLDDVAREIYAYLPVAHDDAGCHMGWQLLFVSADKPHA